MSMRIDPASVPETVTENDRTLAEALEKVLTSLQPILVREGGKARLVSVKETVARVEFKGDGCEGCGGAIEGMIGGLRLMLMERVPGLKEVIFE